MVVSFMSQRSLDMSHQICMSSAKSIICCSSACHQVVSQRLNLTPRPCPLCAGLGAGEDVLSLGRLLEAKQKNSRNSWQRTGIFLFALLKEIVKLVHPLSDKVLERHGPEQVKCFSDFCSNQVLPYQLLAISGPIFVKYS